MKKWKALLAAALLVLAGCAEAAESSRIPEGSQTLSVHFFDAGKADAILLYTDESAVLIDAGLDGYGEILLAYLQEQEIGKLDALICTHFDKDHIGSADEILEGIEVDAVYQSDDPKDSDEYDAYVKALDKAGIVPVTVREDVSFILDQAAYAIDGPAEERYESSSSNNSSLIVRAEYGEKSFLFMGDAEEERISEFLREGPSSCDVLKVPYHGHWQPALEDLLRQAAPSYAVIPSSDEQREDGRTVLLCQGAGAEVLLTRQGAVTIRTDGKTLEVLQEK